MKKKSKSVLNDGNSSLLGWKKKERGGEKYTMTLSLTESPQIEINAKMSVNSRVFSCIRIAKIHSTIKLING